MGKYVSLCIYAYPFKHTSSFNFHNSSFSWCRYSLNFVAVIRYSSCLLFRLLVCLFITFYLYMCWYPYQANFFSVISVCSFSLFALFWVNSFFPSLFLSVTRRSYRSRCFPPSFLFFFLFVSTWVLWYLMCFLNRLGSRLVYLCFGFCPFLILRELLLSL